MNAKATVHSFIASLLLTTSPLISANTYIVTTNADTDGNVCGVDCTLRQAINAANVNAGADNIQFDLDPADTSIMLGSVLPKITETLHINGANDDSDSDSSDSSDDMDKVLIDATAAGSPCNLNAVIDDDRTFFIQGQGAAGTTIKNLHIRGGCFAIDIKFTQDVQVIGNKFEGAGGDGVFIENSDNTLILKNDFSTSRRAVTSGSFTISKINNTIIKNNQISEMQNSCLELFSFSNGLIVNNNFSNCAIELNRPASIFMVPRGTSIDNNLIKGNTFDNSAHPNASAIALATSNSQFIIGDIRGTVNNNKIVNNTIQGGVGPFTLFALVPPIGTPTVGRPIMIADELACGTECTALNNTIIGNEIFNNGGFGVELTNTYAPFVFTLLTFPIADQLIHNGPGVGANNLQAAPMVTSATALDDDELRIVGTLFTEANKSYRIDVYLSDADNANNQAQYHVGHYMVSTDSNGNASINRDLELDDDKLPDDTNLNQMFITTTATEKLEGEGDDDSSS